MKGSLGVHHTLQCTRRGAGIPKEHESRKTAKLGRKPLEAELGNNLVINIPTQGCDK
jgi:hypothetical protein